VLDKRYSGLGTWYWRLGNKEVGSGNQEVGSRNAEIGNKERIEGPNLIIGDLSIKQNET